MPSGLGFSQLATLYYKVPVSATSEGEPVNPTALPVVFAFMPQATQVPQPADWQTAAWTTVPSDILAPYHAYCLVGPGGTIQLGTGTYVIYLKISDSPEVPVLIAGYLQVS